jgi:hypothetical protein
MSAPHLRESNEAAHWRNERLEAIGRTTQARATTSGAVDSNPGGHRRKDDAPGRPELTLLVGAVAPWLLEVPGVGPPSAAQVLVSWTHPGRFRSEAAFAAPAGTNPIPAPSGQVTRDRPDRGGDRQLNRALHTILLVRLRTDPDTRTYMARHTAQGKSRRDDKRCPRRVIARQLFRLGEPGRPVAVLVRGRDASRVVVLGRLEVPCLLVGDPLQQSDGDRDGTGVAKLEKRCALHPEIAGCCHDDGPASGSSIRR